MRGDHAVEQAGGLTGDRIGLGNVGEGENVGRVEESVGRLRIARGFGEAMIKAATACAGDVNEHAVDRAPAVFVGVKSFVEKIAQETAALRDAHRLDAFDGRDVIAVALEVGSEIAHGREPEANHDRILRAVDDLVILPGSNPFVRRIARRPGPILGASTNCHSLRGMVRRLPIGASRTVRTLAGSSGSEQAYSVPPIDRR